MMFKFENDFVNNRLNFLTNAILMHLSHSSSAMLISSNWDDRCSSSMKHNQIQFRAEFTIQEGKIEEFKKLVQEMSRVVEVNEPDTIGYQFYLNREDETKCIVHETYTNSEAVLAHNAGVASQTILPKIFNVSRISRFEVYGNPSEELQKLLTSSFSPQTYNLFAGFSR
jgi:quinol monooxygenase YgiN